MLNRRGFLQSLVGGVALAGAVRTWPFRTYSFASRPKIYYSYIEDMKLPIWAIPDRPDVRQFLPVDRSASVYAQFRHLPDRLTEVIFSDKSMGKDSLLIQGGNANIYHYKQKTCKQGEMLDKLSSYSGDGPTYKYTDQEPRNVLIDRDLGLQECVVSRFSVNC